MKVVSGLYVSTLVIAAGAQQGPWDQCGGNGWSGGTTCISGWSCQYQNPWYSQCLQNTGGAGTTLTTITTSAAPTSTPSSPPAPPKAPSQLRFAGVNIAGFDFGCGTDGTCILADVTPASNAAGQMRHFVNDDNLNIFRLPVGWQYLVNNQLGGSLDSNNMATYDAQVQSCLSTGAHCIIDIHNYARWNGGIIGQGGPSNAQFASLWSQLASKYAGQSNIIFGIMNEPHDVPDINAWAQTVQTVVSAIRVAGATSQMILLPGNVWTSAGAFVSSGSLKALQSVVNPDGSTNNLIFDIHQYLDSDSSGQSTECVTNNINNVFAPLASSLRAINRQALLSETGGGNTASCEQYLCQQLKYLNQNSDVYLGFTAWAAGGFQSSYNLNEVPTQNGNSWVDMSLVTACIAR